MALKARQVAEESGPTFSPSALGEAREPQNDKNDDDETDDIDNATHHWLPPCRKGRHGVAPIFPSNAERLPSLWRRTEPLSDSSAVLRLGLVPFRKTERSDDMPADKTIGRRALGVTKSSISIRSRSSDCLPRDRRSGFVAFADKAQKYTNLFDPKT